MYIGTTKGDLQLWETDPKGGINLVHSRQVSPTAVKCVCVAGDGEQARVFYTTYASGDLVALDPVDWQVIPYYK